jgi:hypothetical protein
MIFLVVYKKANPSYGICGDEDFCEYDFYPLEAFYNKGNAIYYMSLYKKENFKKMCWRDELLIYEMAVKFNMSEISLKHPCDTL